MKPKIIIVIDSGVVAAIHSNIDLNYVVIDRDEDCEPVWDIGLPNTPDSVDDNLSLSNLNYGELKEAVGYENHPWK